MTHIFFVKTLLFSVIMHRFCTEITSLFQKLLSLKNALSLNSTNSAWQKYFCKNQFLFSVIMHWGLSEIVSILQRFFSERNLLSLHYTSSTWLITIMHFVLTKIIPALQKLFSAKKHAWFKFYTSTLYFNELPENFSLWSKVLCVGKLTVMAKIIFHKRYFSKIDPLGQNYAATVIQMIVRNHSKAF